MRTFVAAIIAVIAAVTIAVTSLTFSIVRGPAFHAYADTRAWLGVPYAGDVISNLAFVIVGVWGARELARRGARGSPVLAFGACAGVIAIGVGSGLYHLWPGDVTLALDWAPIVVTLAVLGAAVIEDRLGARAGHAALAIGCALAMGSVAWWIASGGTDGGNMAPYVAVQAVGVALPAILAVVAPGTIRAPLLLLGVLGFALARLVASHDRALLDAVGVSGHSLKHVVAALAAGCALRSLRR